MKTVLLNEFSLAGAPLTALFSPHDPDRSVEEKYFYGWENTQGMIPNFPQRWRTVDDDGVVLEHMVKGDHSLTTGDMFWRSYTIEAEIRHMLPTSKPTADDEYQFIGRSGVFARYQDQRHYYFFCAEGYDKIVLYRRDDENFIPLDWYWHTLSADKYHSFSLTVEENCLICHLDGKRVMRVFDRNYPAGKCGIRTTTLARFRTIQVRTTTERKARDDADRHRYTEEDRILQEKNPKAVLYKKIDLASYGLVWPRFCNLTGDSKRSEIVLFPQRTKDKPAGLVTARTIDGEILWEKIMPSSRLNRPADIDGDGRDEIVAICLDDKLRIIDHDGMILSETSMPKAHPYCSPRNSILDPLFGPYVVNLRGNKIPRDIVLVDDRDGEGGHSLWVYDENLQFQWQTVIDQPAYGHNIHFVDYNRDGKDEILAGYYLLDSSGKEIWRMCRSEYFDVFQAARHADMVLAGNFTGQEDGMMTAFACGGSEGLFLMDLVKGEILAHHRVGHAQSGTIGKFRKDLPGLQLWCTSRWANWGIQTLVHNTGEILHRMEPDVLSSAGYPVSWTGEEEEYFLIASSTKALGLWNGSGRRAVTISDKYASNIVGSIPLAMDVAGDPRDELIFVQPAGIYIFTQENELNRGTNVYSPDRNLEVAPPVVSHPRWILW